MKIVKILTLVITLIISILCFILIKSTLEKKAISKFKLKDLDKNFKKTDKGIKIYEKTEKYLKQMGLKEMVGREISPTEYIMLKLGIMLLLFLAFMKVNIIIALIIAAVSYKLPEIILDISNSSDNEDILPDLKRVYDTLRIQAKAGVYLTVSLTECYLSVKSPRLKTALLELNNNIITKNDIEGAIEDFNSKFKNQYIDTFCIVIQQSIYSGKAVQIMEDLSVQIKDIQEAINIKTAERVKTKLGLLQFLIYIGVISILVYGIFITLSNSLTNF